MLSTHRHRAIAEWLPNEIITEIVQAAPRSDQASLCRVSKLFRDLCLPILYRVVDLEAGASVADFGDTVLSNAALAGLVRSYSVDYYPRVGMSMAAATSFSPILADSSKTLVRLEALSIHRTLLTETDLANLLHWTFPHLVRCSLGALDWSNTEQQHTLTPMTSFLIRHPGLKNLHIQSSPRNLERSSTSVRIPLLRLQQLGCPSRIIPSIVAPRMKRVKLYWPERRFDNVDSIFVALKAMIPSDVPFICSNDGGDGFISAVVDSVSRNLPHTKTLQLHLFLLPSMKEVIGHLKNCLPRFTGLAFISVQYGVIVRNSPNYEAEINVLGDACPTLEACRLHHRAWRKVDGMWEKYPLTDFDALAGLESWTL